MMFMKKQLAFVLVCVMMLAMIQMPTFGQEEARFIVYASVSDSWDQPHVWAWSDEGVNVFDGWPGGEMMADANNPGWYYIWLPIWASNVIVNANDGTVQTSDFKLEGENTWVAVDEAGEFEIFETAQTTGDLPAYVEMIKIHAQVPESWETVGLWAWSHPDGTNAFASWPGEAMKATGDGWFVASAPSWINSIIINGNEGTVQTTDMTIEAQDVWVVVSEDGSAELFDKNPAAPQLDAETIRIHAKAPADWSEIHLWAWSHPDGTNVFTDWPGQPLTLDASGWYVFDVPNWVNSIIINANGGTVQTTDIAIETGKDVWVVVEDAETYVLDYVAIEDAPVAETPVEAAPAPETPDEEDAAGMNVWLIGGALVVLAAAAVYLLKGKK